MSITQLSVFLENKLGRLAEITTILGKNQINVMAMSIADTTDFGILRLIVTEPRKALEVLRNSGFTVKETEVVAVSLDHSPGGLANILNTLEKNHISIEYIYDFRKAIDDNHATVILRLTNQAEAIQLMKKAGMTILDDTFVQNI